MKSRYYLGIITLIVLLLSLYPTVTESRVAGVLPVNYEAGTFAGAGLSDLRNITYDDLGVSAQSAEGVSQSVLSNNSTSTKVLDRVVIRAATSIRAAVGLMDAHDKMWESKLGMRPFTGVPGTDFTSYDIETNPEKWRGYFDSQTEGGIAIHTAGTTLNDSDGDISGNTTQMEEAFSANIGYDNIETFDYAGVNVSEIENVPEKYSRLTDDLLEDEEKRSDWTETGNIVVSATLYNTEADTLEILKARIGLIEEIPKERVRISNYTLAEVYHEKVVSEELGDQVVKAYNDALSAGLLDSFKKLSPVKAVTDTVDAAKSASSAFTSTLSSGGSLRDAVTAGRDAGFESVRGSTSYTNAVALKDNIVEGAKSKLTGLGENIRTGWNKVTETWETVKSGTSKLVSGVTSWFGSLSETAQKIIKIVIVIAIVLLIVFIYFKIKRAQFFSRIASNRSTMTR